MSKGLTDEDFIVMFREAIKRFPKNKAPGDAAEMETAIINALRRAYNGGPRGWQTFDEVSGKADDVIDGFGDLQLELAGSWKLDNNRLMKKVGDAVAAGIQKVIDSDAPDAQEKIRRLSQVAIGAGYICALLDDKAAAKRRTPVMTDGSKRKTEEKRARIRKFAAEHPDMNQEDMAKALGFKSRQTIAKYLNE